MVRMFVIYIFILIWGLSGALLAQERELRLIKDLSDERKRTRAIALHSTCDTICVDVLLGFVKSPPQGTDDHQLRIGLAEYFAARREVKAIEFLVGCLDLQRYPRVNILSQSSEVVAEHFPCASALIEIGMPASAALRNEFDRANTLSRKLLVVFCMARIRDPSNLIYLRYVRGLAGLLGKYSEEGIEKTMK